jgi:hypothetical protein
MPKTFYIIWCSNLLPLHVAGEGYMYILNTLCIYVFVINYNKYFIFSGMGVATNVFCILHYYMQ